MLRLANRLDDETETLIHRVIGCCIAVHRALGPGLLESIYRRAICLELDAAGLSFETEKAVPVCYRGELLCHQRLDLVIEGTVLVENQIGGTPRVGPPCTSKKLSGRIQTTSGLADELQRGSTT